MVNPEIRKNIPKMAIVLDNFSFDNSIIGITLDGRVIYDYDKMVQELMTDEGMEEIDAIEWIDFNVVRALPYAGEKRPEIVCSYID